MQHCEAGDALDLSTEAVRVVKPGGKIVLNYRSKSRADTLILPLSTIMRSLFNLDAVNSSTQYGLIATLEYLAQRYNLQVSDD